MDALMDSMQSIVALAQTGKGIAAFFGLDGTEIDKSIKDLVALQNAMQGLQTIQKQMQAGDGIFKWINVGNKSIDTFTKKLFGVKKATTEVTTATKAQAAATNTVATASKAATTAEATQTTATAGLTVGMKAATVAATALKAVLTTLGIGIVTAAIAGLLDLAKSLLSESKEVKKAREEADKLKKKIDEQRQSFIEASGEYMNTASRISHLRREYISTTDQLRKTSILKEAAAEFKNLGMSVKGVADAETILVKQGDKVVELLKLQGNAAAISAMRMEAYKKSFKLLLEDGFDTYSASIIAGGADEVRALDETLDKVKGKISNLQDDLKIDTGVFDDNKNKVVKSEKELHSEILRLMKDSLTKRLMQLDEEKRQTLNKLNKNSQTYLEAEKRYYELRNKEIEKYIKEQNKLLGEQEKSLVNSSFENQLKEIENHINDLQLTVPTINELFTEDEISANQRYQVALNYLQLVEKAQKEGIDKLTENEKSAYEKLSEDLKKVLATELETIQAYADKENLSLEESFKIRINNARKFYEDTVTVLSKAVEKERDIKREQINFQFSADTYAAAERLKAQQDSYQNEIDAAQKGLEALQKIADSGHTNLTNEQRKHWKEYTDIILVNQEYIKKATANYNAEIKQLEEKKENALIEIDTQAFQKRSAMQEKYFNEQLSNYRDLQSKINQEISKQPVYDSYGFGIINLAKTKKNYEEIRNAVNETLQSIQSDKAKLNEDWQNGLLTPEAYSATLRQLNDVEKSVIESGENITEDLKESGGEWWGAIHEWLQRVADAAYQIMQSIWEYQDNVYDRQVRDIEKAIDEQEKLLDKQKDIIQKHSDAVNSIEDELSSARGDRRQHLIDALNAEIAAQREAAAEEKRLEKEKEKLEKKKEQMAKDQWEKDKARNITTALMNAAMAVSQAATNKWPIPAVPLMAIAAAIGAAQVAAIEAQRYPYAKGGLLEGPSHSQGGIPVGNTGIEVEGQEYVIRKKSTKDNVPILDYINRSERKLTLDDFIDFYSSKPRATIKSIKSTFADGGILNTSPNLDLSNTFDRTIIVKDETPVVVEVVDIMSKASDVRRVQTLAGLSPSKSI